jgi:hypothetical protein
MPDFDTREWNKTIDRICGMVEFPIQDMRQYQFGLIFTIGIGRLNVKENKELFKRNRKMRKALSMWVQDFGRYQEFAEGTWLLTKYYSTEDTLKSDYWTLHEMLTRWQSCMNISMYYGNKYQMKRFVPVAQKAIGEITERMMQVKCKSTKKVDSPSDWRLDAKAIKAQVDNTRIFEYYMPDLRRKGSVYKATCLWHADKHPSFTVYADGGGHCYVCQAHFSDIYSLIMEREGCDFATSIKRALEIGG